MPDLFLRAIEQLPTFIGLILLAYVLWRQNTRLLEQMFGKVDTLSEELKKVQAQIAEIKSRLL